MILKAGGQKNMTPAFIYFEIFLEMDCTI